MGMPILGHPRNFTQKYICTLNLCADSEYAVASDPKLPEVGHFAVADAGAGAGKVSGSFESSQMIERL